MKLLDLHHDPIDDEALARAMVRVFGGRGDERALIAGWREDGQRFVPVAVEDGGVLGWALASVQEAANPASYAEPFGADLTSLTRGEPVAVLHQIAVLPHARRRGVATALASALGQWSRSTDARSVVGVSWSHGGEHHSGHLFEAAGLRVLGRCPAYYRRFHDATGQRCPVCEPEPCDCEAVLYGARFDELHSN
ncbi:MAG: GNAT family N-acetyltransferase [Deltaproteobacteria bacterium]|nr:MAG: GNAT family N-acetyltransferase [Deltaproteobacteria bacterium]